MSVFVMFTTLAGTLAHKQVNHHKHYTYHRTKRRPTQGVSICKVITVEIDSPDARRICSTQCPDKEGKYDGQGDEGYGSWQKYCHETTAERPMQIFDHQIVGRQTKESTARCRPRMLRTPSVLVNARFCARHAQFSQEPMRLRIRLQRSFVGERIEVRTSQVSTHRYHFTWKQLIPYRDSL
jgi:hypothetical protein